MIEIVIKTNPRDGGITRRLPSSWAEVPVEVRLQLMRFLLQNDTATAQVKTLQLLLKLPKSIFLALSNEQITDLAAFLDWYKVDASPTPLLDSFSHNGIIYYLPTQGLENSTAIEYPLADQYFEEFLAKEDEGVLLKLIATLCRESETDNQVVITKGDNRCILRSRYEVETRADKLKGIEPAIASIVLSFFVGCKQLIFETYSEWLFDIPEEDIDDDDDDDDAVEGNIKKEGSFLGWWGIYMDIAEGGVFGNLEQVYQTNFHTICLHLVKKKREALEAERKMKEFNKSNRNEF